MSASASSNSSSHRPSMTSLFTTTQVACLDLTKTPQPIHTGIGFLDHMMDQITSHAQIGVGLTVHHHSDFSTLSNNHTPKSHADDNDDDSDDDDDDEDNNNNGEDQNNYGNDDHSEEQDATQKPATTNPQKKKKSPQKKKDPFAENPNRLASVNQASLLRHVGWTLGSQMALLPKFLGLEEHVIATSRFCCPLDEALVECILTKQPATTLAETTSNNGNGNGTATDMDTDDNSSNKKRKLDDTTTTSTSTTTIPKKTIGRLIQYELAPFGKFPEGVGRTKIGQLDTAALEEFFKAMAKSSGLEISLLKLRGDNGHHIVEATFKAFSRAMRNLLDGTDTRERLASTNIISNINVITNGKRMDHPSLQQQEQQQQQQQVLYRHQEATFQQAMWGETSANWKASLALKREGTVERSTKETKIQVKLALDGGTAGVAIQTGIDTLDEFLTVLAKEACMSLTINCTGDLWVDDHHTAEDVAIAVGQVLTQALGTKAGLNRMWCARQAVVVSSDKEEKPQAEMVEVTMDLSNRPCLTHNLGLGDCSDEKIEDLSVEMLDHVLDSLVVNGRMTVHIVLSKDDNQQQQSMSDSNGPISASHLKDRATATAAAFGKALKYCAMVDHRRAGQTASSKGTLSV